MFILSTLSYIMIILLLTSMMAKIKPWRKLEKPGKNLKTLPMPWQARLKLHQHTLFALGFAVVFGLASGWMPASYAFMISALCLAGLLLPMQYTLTQEGVAIGDVFFRQWREFPQIEMKRRRVILKHQERSGGLTLFINEDDFNHIYKKIKH